MKTLQNNFTTPVQSKRLLELGLPADSADFYWTHEHKRGVLPRVTSILTTFTEENQNHYSFNDDDYLIPCWSVGRLIEIISIVKNPAKFDDKIALHEDIQNEYSMTYVEFLCQVFEHGVKHVDFSKLED